MTELRQGTAVTVKAGALVDDTGSPIADANIARADTKLSKNGGTLAQKNESSNSALDADGHYDVALDTTDVGTMGTLRLEIVVAGALPYWRDFEVVSQQYWDSKYSTDKLQVDLVEWRGTQPATLVSTLVPADAIAISGSTIAADNAESNIGNLDAAVTTRLASGSYVAPDNATISTINGNVNDVETLLGTVNGNVNDIETLAGTINTTLNTVNGNVNDIETKVDTIDSLVDSALIAIANVGTDVITGLGRLGSFTGSGVNNVLGFLRAIMRADATTPSDVGGTYDDATDSLEALSGAVSSIEVELAPEDIELIANEVSEAVLEDLGDLTDPLQNPVPGSYPDGSAGQVLGLVPPIYTRALLIGTPQGRLEVPWPAAEGSIELEVGDDYTADSGRLLPGRETAWWAVLNLPTAQSITLTATAPKLPDITVALTIADDVLSTTQIQIQFPKAVTAQIRRYVDYDFKVVAVLNASTHGGNTVTIWKGNLSGT